MHLNSVLLYRRWASSIISEGDRVLEIGPDASPSAYETLAPRSVRWETAELQTSFDDAGTPRFSTATPPTYSMTSEYEIPVADETFDVVVSGQVIEHVRRPWVWLPELARVCRQGGHVIVVAPVSWPYHPAPADCWRIYPDGMRALCEDAGLDVLVAECASLEPRVSRRSYAGTTHDYGAPATLRRRLAVQLQRLLGWPTSSAVDTIAVARRPVISGLGRDD